MLGIGIVRASVRGWALAQIVSISLPVLEGEASEKGVEWGCPNIKRFWSLVAFLCPHHPFVFWYHQFCRNPDIEADKKRNQPCKTKFEYCSYDQFCKMFRCKIFATFTEFASLVQIHHGAAKTFQILKTWKVSRTCRAVSSVSTWTLYPIKCLAKRKRLLQYKMHLIRFLI